MPFSMFNTLEMEKVTLQKKIKMLKGHINIIYMTFISKLMWDCAIILQIEN
jgi:hypothetical protein